ncbi:MAG: hypothetical protein O3B87_01755 [bacterium]|nr:hypothetical protein [bacterium]
MQSIFAIPPNDLHHKLLTNWYKLATSPLKRMPFIYIVPLSLGASLAVYMLFGQLIIQLVSLLQYGF